MPKFGTSPPPRGALKVLLRLSDAGGRMHLTMIPSGQRDLKKKKKKTGVTHK